MIIAGWFTRTVYLRWMYRDAQPVTFEVIGSNPEIKPLEIAGEMIIKLNQDRALEDLQRLTGAAPICIDAMCYTINNRRTGSEGLAWAKDYLYSQLIDLGYTIEIQDWSASGFTDQNILARKAGGLIQEEQVFLSLIWIVNY